ADSSLRAPVDASLRFTPLFSRSTLNSNGSRRSCWKRSWRFRSSSNTDSTTASQAAVESLSNKELGGFESTVTYCDILPDDEAIVGNRTPSALSSDSKVLLGGTC